MTLDKENRDNIVKHRLQKAHNTFAEVKGIVNMKYWHSAANRLYYACYYAVSALLINNGYETHTHGGVFRLLGKHFVVTGIISNEHNKLYRKLFELRQKGDYDDWITIEAEDVLPRLQPAQKFIEEIEKLISQNSTTCEP